MITKKIFGRIVVLTSLMTIPFFVAASDCEDDECGNESAGAAYHLHFSSEEIDIYEQTPDTLYRDADWPSKVEEYSDYLSH